jgi:outer membrane protein insertion porin family
MSSRGVLRGGLGAALLLGSLCAPAWAQEDETAPVVERVEVVNNQYLQKETLLFYVSTKPGERYDERRLRDDFRRLWDTGFLDDLSVESRDGAQGKIVIFRVSERKRVQIVDYRGSKALTTTTIEDELKKRDAALKIDSFYEPSKARRVEEIIEEMLTAKGRPFGDAKHDAKTIGGAGMQVSFVIDDGPKAKVKEIVFDGNEVFSDGKLRGRMKKIKPAGFFNLSWLGGKSTYTPEKWSGGEEDPRGDQGRLEDFYLNHGYVQARVGQPRISYSDKPGSNPKKPAKWMKLEIPVSEGPQFRVGEIKFDGLTVFKEEFVRTLFKLKPGDVYNESRLKKGFDKLRDLYGAVGYFQWTGGPRKKPDPERKIVDVTLAMEEDKRYFVGKITFTGNDSTRDKVIRREIYMNEGDVFNTDALKQSIRRVNQLGYFKPMEGAPDLKANEKADDKIDVTFKVEEQNRNQFTFGGGVSGLEGTFINASFSTANFLGAGETFSISAQTGRRTKNYQIAITEPYFLDRPITAGFDVFKRKITYLSYVNVVGFTQEGTGASLIFGVPVRRWGRLFTNYSYEVVKLSDVTQDIEGNITPISTGDEPVFDPLLFGGQDRTESRFTPSFVWNTVDNPYNPRAGVKYSSSMTIAGGPLGGTIDYFRPNLEVVVYIPQGRKTALGLRADVGWIKTYGRTLVKPYYLRYFLGGETQLRGYNLRTVGPFDSSGRALGGNKYLLFNAEYYFDVFGPLRALLFFDAGQAFIEGDMISFKGLRTSTGAELRFIMPVLNVPFRLIYAWNPHRDAFHDKTTFKFAVGTTF